MPRLSVAAPCFNEAESIASVVAEWDRVLESLPFESEISLCNDGSTDATAEILEELQRKYARLRVVSFGKNGGYGRALAAAIAATRGEWVVTMDSDGQFNLEDVGPLFAVIEQRGIACATGFRRKKQDSFFRVIADRGLNLLVRALFGVPLRDTNCAIKLVRGDLMRGLRIEARGYPTPTEMVIRLHALGHEIGEVGVEHRERLGGASKLHPWRTAWSMLRFLLYLRLKLALYRARILVEP